VKGVAAASWLKEPGTGNEMDYFSELLRNVEKRRSQGLRSILTPEELAALLQD